MLAEQEKAIEDAEQAYSADHQFTIEEARARREQRSLARRGTFAEKPDIRRWEMPMGASDKNAFAKDAFLKQRQHRNLLTDTWRGIVRELYRAHQLRRDLRRQKLSRAGRARLQAEYNAILNKYLEVR
jgi:hypothetical protein